MEAKRIVFVLGLIGYMAVPGWSDCPYFRVNYKLLKCAEWKESEPLAQPVDIPEDVTPITGTAVKISCSCDYSLTGSDPRCDFDQTLEQFGIRGADKPDAFCARGKELCADVCSPRLP